MATIYLRSTDGSDSDDGLTWATAKATLQAAMTAAGAGGLVYVSQAHAESHATTQTITSPGTAASPIRIACVNDSTEPPTSLATTASVSTTGASNLSLFTTTNSVQYVYGITFSAGSGGSNGAITLSSGYTVLEHCGLILNNTGNGSRINLGGTAVGVPELIDCTMTFGAVGQGAVPLSKFIMRGGSIAASGSVPTTLFAPVWFCEAVLYGVDLSTFGSGKTLTTLTVGSLELITCKLGSGVAIVDTTTNGNRGISVRAVNSDSADTNYNFFWRQGTGLVIDETTIVRTGGASDGTTPISYKFTTLSGAAHHAPIYSPWVYFWNETTGSPVTVASEVVTDGVTLTDAEAWIEVEYLGTSGFPLSLLASDRITDPIFGTPANQTTSSVTWTTTGLSSPVKQTLSKQVTPQEKGPIRFRVALARASTTMYADLKAA